jgi:PAS domain S-box-containing protein
LGLEILDLDAATHSAIVQAAFDASPIGVAVVDARGLIRAVNPALAQLTGYTRAELTGAPIERLVPDAQRSVHVAARNAYRHAPTSRPMGAQTEIHARHKSGQTLPVEVGLQTCMVGGAQLTVAVVNDLSTRKYAEAEARLRASNAQLEAVRRALIRFLGRSDMHACMDGLLGELLSLTDSAYGFIGEIRRDEGGIRFCKSTRWPGSPSIRTRPRRNPPRRRPIWFFTIRTTCSAGRCGQATSS